LVIVNEIDTLDEKWSINQYIEYNNKADQECTYYQNSQSTCIWDSWWFHILDSHIIFLLFL